MDKIEKYYVTAFIPYEGFMINSFYEYIEAKEYYDDIKSHVDFVDNEIDIDSRFSCVALIKGSVEEEVNFTEFIGGV